MTVAINSLTVDCHDPHTVARFWSAALTARVTGGASSAGECWAWRAPACLRWRLAVSE